MSLISRLSIHYSVQGLSQGLLLSVITLFMVEKGMALWQVGVAFGTFSLSAALLELPLGATADLHGRIRVFRLSQLVSIVGLIIAALATSFVWVLLAMLCLGLTRALESGSVSAWEVEQIRRQGQGDRLAELLGRFQAINALSIAVGALAGGYLPTLFTELLSPLAPTSANLFVAAAITSIHVLLLPWLFREGDPVVQPEQPPTVMGQIQTAVQLARGSQALRSVLMVGFAFGLILSNMEAYWQPRLNALLDGQGYALFGWIATGYFISAAIGPALFSALSSRLSISASTTMTLLLVIVAPLLWTLAISDTVPMFALFYCLFIAVLVCINIPAQVITNEHTQDEVRSTMQSVVSLIMQLGGAVSAFGFSWLIEHLGIAVVWQSLAVGLMILAVFRCVNAWRCRPRTTLNDASLAPSQSPEA
ncbi:MFS transporter [Reinekea blandensis]|uniref:Multidrug-efflux transporter, putative n=1 Tax=Reinekea blandensis MED297 TaxID=314283 RepID=A4BET0_9GAMM|nr:MFS transporter [Reinekea blandensis]EAR09265.1 multidrug-efflux transporter, putative [Reinekea sp. MED297] [Reinekea blandensis MED297]